MNTVIYGSLDSCYLVKINEPLILFSVFCSYNKECKNREFPGGPKVRTLCFHCQGPQVQSLVRELDLTNLVTLPRGGKERMYKEMSEINFNIFNFNPNIIISNVISGIFVCIIFKILCVFSFLNFTLINSFFFKFYFNELKKKH